MLRKKKQNKTDRLSYRAFERVPHYVCVQNSNGQIMRILHQIYFIVYKLSHFLIRNL